MKFGNYTYKQKNKLLLGGTVCFLLLAWLLAFSKTIGLYNENKTLEEKLSHSKEAPEQIDILEKENEKLELTFRHLSGDQDIKRILLQNFVEASHRYKVLFKHFSDKDQHVRDGMIVETHEIVLQGSFIGLVRLCKELENSLNAGKLVSVRFALEEDKRTKNQFLLAYIYVQSIKVATNEKNS